MLGLRVLRERSLLIVNERLRNERNDADVTLRIGLSLILVLGGKWLHGSKRRRIGFNNTNLS